jgi:hypothetical protein
MKTLRQLLLFLILIYTQAATSRLNAQSDTMINYLMTIYTNGYKEAIVSQFFGVWKYEKFKKDSVRYRIELKNTYLWFMAYKTGNELWKMRGKHGRDYKYTPDKLWEEFLLYCQWVNDNPLLEDSVNFYQGQPTHEPITRMRAMTIIGFCLFSDLDTVTYYEYRKNNDFTNIINAIENCIREQKFTGAAAELLNPNIIARDLGLVDKTDTTIHVPEEKIYVPDKETQKELDKLRKSME